VGAAGEDGGKGVKSLEDITSMEDIVSLEALQLDQLKTSAASDKNDRVRSFRRTVKAMSTQVTPQTSPLSMHLYIYIYLLTAMRSKVVELFQEKSLCCKNHILYGDRFVIKW